MSKKNSDFDVVFENIQKLSSKKAKLFTYLNSVQWSSVLHRDASNKLTELFSYFESNGLMKATPIVLKVMLEDVFKNNPELLRYKATYFGLFFGETRLPEEKRLSIELNEVCKSNHITQDHLAEMIKKVPCDSRLKQALVEGRLLSNGGVPTFPHETFVKLGVV